MPAYIWEEDPGLYRSLRDGTTYTPEVPVEDPIPDQEELAPAHDTPVVTFGSTTAGAAPDFGGSITTAGWQREKRSGVAETAPGASQTSTAALDLDGSTRFRYPGILSAIGMTGQAGNIVRTPLKTGGGPQSAHWLFNLEFTIRDTDRVMIRLQAPVANSRFGVVYVNGRRITPDQISVTGVSAGGFYWAQLVFPDVRTRTIKIYGLSHNEGRFGGAAVPTGGSISKPTHPYVRKIVFLGDSFTNGAAGVSGLQTFVWDLARTMGADLAVQLGIGGTGFVNNGSDPDGLFINRVPDILALNPDVLVIVGGRNDNNTGMQAAVNAVLDATEDIPERYVISNAVGAAISTSIQNAANSRSVPFVSMSDHPSLVELAGDNVHPTYNGHRQFAAILAERMGLIESEGEPSEGLFFELPDTSSSDKLAFAHFYPPMPRSFSNTQTDVYENSYLPVNGEGGIHAAFGGWVRNRPMTDAPYPAPYTQTMTRRCIEDAIQSGIDGFFVNILGASGVNWDRLAALATTASNEYPGFWIVPMLDCNGSTATGQTNEVIAARIAHFANRPSAFYLPDGRYLISGYRTVFAGTSNAASATKWQQIFDLLETNHGVDSALVGVFNNWTAQYTGGAFNGLLYAAGMWAVAADPNVWANHGDRTELPRSRGEKVLSAVWPQDIRPRSQWFDEARNTGSLRASWARAISDDADIVQLCTWSDFTEGSSMMSNVKSGHAWLDISAWYQARWKTGVAPPILRDALYVSHRNQMANATVTGGQTQFMTHRSVGNMSSFREHVEILTFLTAPATISVKIASTIHEYTAPAGMHVQTYPMQPGHVSAKAVRTGQEVARVNSPVVIKSTTVNDDREYCVFSSIRGTAGQYDPTPGSPTPTPSEYIT